MDKPSYEVRLAGWHDIVLAATNRPHGILLKDWLANNNISVISTITGSARYAVMF